MQTEVKKRVKKNEESYEKNILIHKKKIQVQNFITAECLSDRCV